jgi:hypothetical protein
MTYIFDFAENRTRPVEWPTWAALGSLWLAFGLLTFFHASLPWWILSRLAAA